MKFKLLLSLLVLVLLVGTANANWKDVQSDAMNTASLVNLTTAAIQPSPLQLFRNSLMMDGTGSIGVMGNKSDTLWNFTTIQNKTVEFWLLINASTDNSMNNKKYLFFNNTAGGDPIFIETIDTGADSGLINLSLGLANFGSLPTADHIITHSIVNDSAWHHVAITWYNTTANGTNLLYLRTFFDGVSILTLPSRQGEAGIDFIGFGKGASLENMMIDEVRVSNVSRYTANFTRSTTAFTPDVNTLALYHFDDYDIPLNNIRQCDTAAFYESVAINFTFFDEVNQTRLDNITKFEGTFLAQGIDNRTAKINLSFSKDDPRFITLCISPKEDSYYINATIKYEKEGWNFRNWHFVNKIFNENTINESLFLLQGAKATLDTVLITDSLDNALENIVTEVDRFYISNNTHRTIGIIKSGSDGKDVIYLQNNEADYRFKSFRDGVLIKTTTSQKMTSASYTIKILPTTLTDLINNVREITSNITYDNHTKYFIFGFNDPGENMAGACLQVSISNISGIFFKPLNCSYGTFNGILRGNPGNYTPQTGFGYGYVIFNGSTINFASQTLSVEQSIPTHLAIWGKYGIYLLLILVVGIVMIFIGNPVGIILALMICIYISWWMDIFTISTVALTGLMIGLGVLLKELRS